MFCNGGCGTLLTGQISSKEGTCLACLGEAPKNKTTGKAKELSEQILEAIKGHGRTSAILERVCAGGIVTQNEFMSAYLHVISGQAGFAKVVLHNKKGRMVHDAYVHMLYIFASTRGGGRTDFAADGSKIFCTCRRCDAGMTAHVPAGEITAANKFKQAYDANGLNPAFVPDYLNGYVFVKHTAWPEFFNKRRW